jgi:hypothetical protein
MKVVRASEGKCLPSHEHTAPDLDTKIEMIHK